MEATLTIMGKKYVGKGKTASEAIEAISYKGFARFKSVLTLNGKTMVLMPLQTMRLFAPSKMIREVAIKNLTLRF
jgi:hypothetical protein